MVFIHGGYWRARMKEEFAFVAGAFTPAGITTVMVEYDLCPTVTLDEIVADRHAVPAAAALELAQRYGLTPYDAAYLWLAERLEAPLVTFDARLGEAARRHLEGAPDGS